MLCQHPGMEIDEPLFPGWLFGAFFAVFAVFFVTVVIGMGFITIRRWQAAKQQGLDPLAADVQLMGQVQRSALLAEGQPIEQRLAELDRLLQQGAISEAEHAQARARILGEL